MSATTRRKHAGAVKCRRKFLGFFPDGFRDPDYLDLERDYKWRAHQRWQQELSRRELARLLLAGDHRELAARAIRIEGRTNLLFSFEKMALRDALRTDAGAELFARGLRDVLHGRGDLEARFERWIDCVARLPRRQTRVLTWPVVTVFPFLAQPETHFFLKPTVTRAAARAYGASFPYQPRPSWDVYAGVLRFADELRRDLADLQPRDHIDLQSFLWVLGSDEY